MSAVVRQHQGKLSLFCIVSVDFWFQVIEHFAAPGKVLSQILAEKTNSLRDRKQKVSVCLVFTQVFDNGGE